MLLGEAAAFFWRVLAMKRSHLWNLVCGAAVLAAGFSTVWAGDAGLDEWVRLLDGPALEKPAEKAGEKKAATSEPSLKTGGVKTGVSRATIGIGKGEGAVKGDGQTPGAGLAGMAEVLTKGEPLKLDITQAGTSYLVKAWLGEKVFFEGIGLVEKDLLITAGVRNNVPELVIFQMEMGEGAKAGMGKGGGAVPVGLKRVRGVAMPKPGEKGEAFDLSSQVKKDGGEEGLPATGRAAAVSELASGVYSLAGVNGGGGRYTGELTLENIAKVCRLHWLIGRDETYDGVGLMEGDLFCVACTMQGRACVVVYKMKKNGEAAGRWVVTPGQVLVEDVKLTLKGKLPEKGEAAAGGGGAGAGAGGTEGTQVRPDAGGKPGEKKPGEKKPGIQFAPNRGGKQEDKEKKADGRGSGCILICGWQ
jgi:hypothetical protein